MKTASFVVGAHTVAVLFEQHKSGKHAEKRDTTLSENDRLDSRVLPLVMGVVFVMMVPEWAMRGSRDATAWWSWVTLESVSWGQARPQR